MSRGNNTVGCRIALLAASLALPPLAATADARPPYSVLLIVVDGLRADRLGLYGHRRPTSPNLDRRAARAIVFENAVAQANWTLPSFASLFSSRYPQVHAANSGRRRLGPEPLLPEVLQASGYRTGGFVGGHFLDPIFGFSRGFALYRAGGWGVYRYLSATAPQAARWIREQGGRPFFALVHGNDVHPPFDLPDADARVRHVFDAEYAGPVDATLIDYTFVSVFSHGKDSFSQLGFMPPPDYLAQADAIRDNPRDVSHIGAHYDGRVLEADRELEALFAALEASGRDEDTIVVVTADHGLELGEKGTLGAGFHAATTLGATRVPLLIWHPDLSPRRIPSPVQLVDLAPTLLAALDLRPPRTFQGRSLLPLMRGERPAGETLAFSAASVLMDGSNLIRLHSAQDARWKLVLDTKRERYLLYDLLNDPKEGRDVSPKHPEPFARLRAALDRHLRDHPAPR